MGIESTTSRVTLAAPAPGLSGLDSNKTLYIFILFTYLLKYVNKTNKLELVLQGKNSRNII